MELTTSSFSLLLNCWFSKLLGNMNVVLYSDTGISFILENV